MVTKNEAYQMLLSKAFGIREECDVETRDVYACIYDKKTKERSVLVRTLILVEGDAACWISAAIRHDVQRLIQTQDIKKGSYKMNRLMELEKIAGEIEKENGL